jgi:hypothetical protein
MVMLHIPEVMSKEDCLKLERTDVPKAASSDGAINRTKIKYNQPAMSDKYVSDAEKAATFKVLRQRPGNQVCNICRSIVFQLGSFIYSCDLIVLFVDLFRLFS